MHPQAEAVAWWKPSDYFRLAALACDSQERRAAHTLAGLHGVHGGHGAARGCTGLQGVAGDEDADA